MEIDEKISVRFERNELKRLDGIVKKAGYSNRSEFIRNAVEHQVELEKKRNCVTVEVPNLVMGYIDALVEKGYYRSAEHAVQTAIDSYFDHERIESALKAAKGMEVISGKSIEIDVNAADKKVVKK